MIKKHSISLGRIAQDVRNDLIAVPNEEASNTHLVLKCHGGTWVQQNDRLEVVSIIKSEDASRTWIISTPEMVYSSFSLKCQ